MSSDLPAIFALENWKMCFALNPNFWLSTASLFFVKWPQIFDIAFEFSALLALLSLLISYILWILNHCWVFASWLPKNTSLEASIDCNWISILSSSYRHFDSVRKNANDFGDYIMPNTTRGVQIECHVLKCQYRTKGLVDLLMGW
jgi:hypothetical protein